MTLLATLLLHLLFGFGHPIEWHQETMPNGAVVQCSQYHACVPFEGNTSQPTLPSEAVP